MNTQQEANQAADVVRSRNDPKHLGISVSNVTPADPIDDGWYVRLIVSDEHQGPMRETVNGVAILYRNY